MAWDYKFSPVTEDLIDDGKGGFVLTENADTAMSNALKAHYRRCWQDPELGSQLHNLELFKADPENLIPSEVKRALSRLETAGRISAIESKAEQPFAGRVNVLTRAKDNTTGQPVEARIKTGG